LNVRDRVVFTGIVSPADLPAHYAMADIFLHPNRISFTDSEGFGIVLLEAQASGKPVIGGRTGGVPETMIEGKTGLLVSGEDVAETTCVLRRLIEDEGLRARMGAAGRRHVSERFSWDVAARTVEDTHRQVLEFETLSAARRAEAD
jgi:phosphatidylinositol alpha-1,6-mannosyltransferase